MAVPFEEMPFTQFVEVGRLALIVYGELVDKLAVIVDIIDDKRVMIDVIGCKCSRQAIPIKRLRLTDYVAKIEKNAAPDAVQEAAAEAAKEWENSKWGKKVAAQKAASELNDFQRFKYAQLVAKRDSLVAQELAKH